MAVSYAKSTDAGAPVLSGQASGLLALLDALLINGFGTYTPPDGWEAQFASGNVKCYRSTHAASHACVLRVDNADRNALVRGFSSMSDVDTGTDPWPLVSQLAGGLVWTVSETSNATARPWYFAGDSRFFHLFVNWGGLNPLWDHYAFGDLTPHDPADTTNTIIDGAENTIRSNMSIAHTGLYATESVTGAAGAAADYGLWIRQPHAGGNPIRLSRVGLGTGLRFGGAGAAYPFPFGGGLLFVANQVKETAAYSVRGIEPGFFCPAHTLGLGNGTVFSALPELAGANALSLRLGSAGSVNTTGECLIQTSGDW